MMQATTRLPAPERYDHFVKMVADWGFVWGLYNDGWATTETDDGMVSVPLWSARDYAANYQNGDWSEFDPRAISIHEFLDEFLPRLNEGGVCPGVFYVDGQGSVAVPIEILVADLRAELSRVE